MSSIRKEIEADHPIIFEIIKKAFEHMEHSDGSEPTLVDNLRRCDAYINNLSLVYTKKAQLIGHVIVSKIFIESDNELIPSLALGPISVLPNFQNQGIGSALMKEAHRRALDLGFKSIILVGNPEYYNRFGYKQCAHFGLILPWELPPEVALAVELEKDSLANISGKVIYSAPFLEL